MTAQELEELERLEALATPGPWGPAHGKVKEEDARFIAAFRTHAKALIEAAKQGLKNELAR